VPSEKNKLYYGDNYEVLQRYVDKESVDLIYLDPPFNSRQDYNVLFAEKDGTQSSSQIHAFEDTWEWNIDAARSYQHIVEQGGRVADAMRAFHTFLGGSDMMAYLGGISTFGTQAPDPNNSRFFQRGKANIREIGVTNG
jgi:hypothetical protein